MEDTKTCLEKQPLSQEMLEKMNAYWRAANYLSAGQLYLLDNPLLKEPLTMDQIKNNTNGDIVYSLGYGTIFLLIGAIVMVVGAAMILVTDLKNKKK